MVRGVEKMPRIRKCTVCGREFLSVNGIQICGEECRQERKKQQDKAGNFRRYNKLSNTPIDKVCPVCGNNFQGLREIYCSPECSRRARERAVKENSKQYYLDHKKGSQ